MKQYGNRLDPHSKSSCKVLVMTGRWTIVPLVVVCSLYLFSCGGIIQPEPGQLFQFDFANGAQGWSAGFSDYPAGQEAFFEPQPVLQSNGQFLMNIDKGNQSLGGKDAIVIGTIENSSTDCVHLVYETKRLDSVAPFTVRTAATGSLWLLVGTDSGFEGTTSLYYRQFRAAFAELPQ